MTITCKQLGDAAEHLVLARLMLAGVPTAKMPDNWPGYDLMAEHPTLGQQRISVKASRNTTRGGANIEYDSGDRFDWLAIVMLDGAERIYLCSRQDADAITDLCKNGRRYVNTLTVDRKFAAFAGVSALAQTGAG